MKSPSLAQDLEPVDAGPGCEDLVEDLDAGDPVLAADVDVLEALVDLQLGPPDGPAEVRPVAVRLEHREGEPAVVPQR